MGSLIQSLAALVGNTVAGSDVVGRPGFNYYANVQSIFDGICSTLAEAFMADHEEYYKCALHCGCGE